MPTKKGKNASINTHDMNIFPDTAAMEIFSFRTNLWNPPIILAFACDFTLYLGHISDEIHNVVLFCFNNCAWLLLSKYNCNFRTHAFSHFIHTLNLISLYLITLSSSLIQLFFKSLVFKYFLYHYYLLSL